MTEHIRKLSAGYLDYGGRAIAVLVVAGLAAMLLLNGASVALRILGFRSIHWAHEISLVIALGVYFLGYGLIVRRSAEIRVEFAVAGLPRRVRRVVDLVGDVLQFALYVTFGILVLRYANRISMLPMPITRLSEALIYIPVVVGFLDAAAVVALRGFVRRDQAGAASPPAPIR